MSLIQGFLEGLRPTPSLKVHEWADRYRFLSSVSSAEPGRWKTSRVPYMYEIFDKLSPSDPCREVVLQKGVQIAGTEAALNCVGAYIDLEPCPIMYVMPTVDTAKQLSKKRLHHMINESPTLREKVIDQNRREGSSTVMEKNFPGGVLFLTGANSAAGLRSNPVRVIIFDETDGYPLSIGDEGNPIKLGEARATTFQKNKKIFKLSTPTIAGESAIAQAMAETDDRTYRVPCPHCGSYQELVFENLKWEDGQPDTAKYECADCHELIEEYHKTDMLANGYWKATRPEMSSEFIAGYRINSLYSPLGWVSWPQIVRKFLNEKDDPLLFQTFVNTILGEPWENRGDAPDHVRLFERRESYKMNSPNNSIEMITVGVDVQKDRLELEVVGWCRNKETYSIDYRVIDGDTADEKVWEKLALVINEKWIREDGIELPMMMMAVDSGYNTQFVYNFCRKHGGGKAIAVKGSDTQKTIVGRPSPVDVAPSGKKIGRIKVWSVGVSILKSELYANLRLNRNEDGTYPPRYCHFPEYPMEHFKGITAEQLVFREHKGFRKYEWEKTYQRNEPLDCRNYARAAADILGLDRMNDSQWDALVGRYLVHKKEHSEPVKQESAMQEQRKRVKRDSFWG